MAKVRLERPLETADVCVRILSSHAGPDQQDKAKKLLDLALEQLLTDDSKPTKSAREA